MMDYADEYTIGISTWDDILTLETELKCMHEMTDKPEIVADEYAEKVQQSTCRRYIVFFPASV